MSAVLDDEKVLGDAGWPYSTRYFVNKCMDAGAKDLLRTDSDYATAESNTLQCVDITVHAASHSIITNPVLSSDPAPDTSRIIFVDLGRRYFDNATRIDIRLSRQEWSSLLTEFHFPPPVLQILHDNNGGSFQHTSFCGDNSSSLSPCKAFRSPLPCAYHIAMKHCVWHFDHFLYGRYDFHTRSTTFIVAGSSTMVQVDQLTGQFSSPGADMFDIILSLMSVWAREVEEMRWHYDFVVQSYESRTGLSALGYNHKIPVPREKMRFKTDMAASQDSLRVVARASGHLGELFAFVRGALPRFAEVCEEHGSRTPSTYMRQMTDALDMRITQARSQSLQIADLKTRIAAQWDIVNAILSHYNNDLTIGMATDSRADSVVMRRIALVTMIFLPATFLATFFSMVFFDAEGAGLHVNSWIWLYVVCTVPVTLALLWQYGLRDRLLWIIRGPKDLRGP